MTTRRVLVLAVALVAGAALPVPGGAEASHLGGNLCTSVSKAALAELKIPGPCVQVRTNKAVSTPLGLVHEWAYQARWGSSGSVSAPTHHLTVGMIRIEGSAAALAYAAKSFRGHVLANGALVKLNPLTTVSGDTYACHNPPTADCTSFEGMALAGDYGVTVIYKGPAKFVAADDPQNPDVDDANDRSQEAADKSDVVALINSITAAL